MSESDVSPHLALVVGMIATPSPENQVGSFEASTVEGGGRYGFQRDIAT